MRRVEHEEIEAARVGAKHARASAEGFIRRDRRLRPLDRFHHGGIAGNEGDDLDVLGGERCGQGAGDVGEAAGFDQRKNFGDDGQNGECCS